MFMFLIKMLESRLFLPIVASLGIGFIYTTGFVQGNNHCAAKQIKIEQKLEKKYDKIETNVDNLADKQLDKLLRQYTRD